MFEMAEGGTLFLDEIGEMPLHLQAKLLSVIEEKRLRRIGSESLRPVNVRIIAATSVKLEDTLGAAFRKDLYYRLSVVRIHIPPLRERRQDIPALCMHLLGQLSGGRQVQLEEGELPLLMAYHWPGNVRELKNILERSVLLQAGPLYKPSELLGEPSHTPPASSPPLQENDELLPLEEVEHRHIRHVLDKLAGNYTRAAKVLGISLSTLKRKLKEQNG